MMQDVKINSYQFLILVIFFTIGTSILTVPNLKDYRPLTIPLGIIAVVLSLVIFPNVISQQNFDQTTQLSFSLSMELLSPLLLVVVYAIRKKTIKKEA